MAKSPQTPATFPIQQKQAMFFQDPLVEVNPPGFFSTLYLLRRDLNDTRAAMPTSGFLPQAMMIMAGIDLLAKFFANSDATKELSTRYRNYLATFVTSNNNPEHSENQVLYQFRCSILDSFGWSSSDKNISYHFRLVRDQQDWLTQYVPTNFQNWFVNLTQLELDFERSIKDYESAINDAARPAITFPTGLCIFENYGWMEIS